MTYKEWFPGGPGDWFEGAGSREDERPVRPKLNLPFGKPAALVLGTLFILFFLIRLSAGFLTDLYWFRALGLSSVFWTRIIPQWVLLALASLSAFAVLFWSYRTALRRSGEIPLPPEIAGSMPLRAPLASWVVFAAAAGLALVSGNGIKDQWEMVLRFLNAAPFGKTDPIFGMDMGFYVFSLPFYRMFQSWAMEILFLCLAGSALIYGLALLPGFQLNRRIAVPKFVRAHILVIAALLALNWAFGYWLERFNLLYSPRGVAFGASYTDIHADLLALNIMTVLSVLVAALLLLGITKKTWKFSIAVIGSLFATGAVLRGIYPEIIQKYVVVPNEFSKEEPYIEHNIKATLEAYGLDSLTILNADPEEYLTAEDLDDDPETLTNIRLWEREPLLRNYKQLQEIRSYYDFYNADIDRYTIDGQKRQVMIAARELNLREMQNPTWTNTKLEFTHGYGIVMSPVNEVTESGRPVLWIKDLPSASSVPLDIEKPQIYYGKTRDNYVFVKTTVQEFDYPMGESNVRTTYDGLGGVPIGSLWRRLIYALSFNDSKIIFSDVFTPESRVMYNKNIRERLQKIAPFLLYDSEPYIAVIDGRLTWIQDCYTATGDYPYAEPVIMATHRGRTRINYIRNSVKATVDAYDGTVTFYVMDGDDPLITTWRRIFPSIFTDGSRMSPDLKAHIRYPKGLFSIQSEIYRIYHMQDPNTFYNKEDVWETLKTDDRGSMDSYYLIMTLSGEEKAEFAIISPFMPLAKNNMIAWLAGRSDGGKYGRLVVYKFPKQRLIYGPTQVAALVDQDPEISSQLSLWSQRGSDVIRGNMLVIPLGKSLLYVQPLYLRAERGDLPELKRVIVSTGGRVAWAENFGHALEILTGNSVPAPSPVPASRSPESHDVGIHNLALRAQNIWEKAQRALKTGDWALYGRCMDELEAVISKMASIEEP